MTDEARILEHIQAHWRFNHAAQLQAGVWVGLHERLPDDAYQAFTPVRRAWFLSSDSVVEKAPISFKIFVENKVRVPVGKPHEMGEANFAPYSAAGLYYLDIIVGPLHGRGMQLRLASGGLETLSDLWVS